MEQGKARSSTWWRTTRQALERRTPNRPSSQLGVGARTYTRPTRWSSIGRRRTKRAIGLLQKGERPDSLKSADTCPWPLYEFTRAGRPTVPSHLAHTIQTRPNDELLRDGGKAGPGLFEWG